MTEIRMKQLLEAGVHFGHQTSRWNPKMKPYIFGARNGIYIIDLQQTVRMFRDAYDFVRDLAAQGGTILFVGTKKQAQDTVREEAERCGHVLRQQPLAGRNADQLPDHPQVASSGCKKLEEMMDDPESSRPLTKKEMSEHSDEHEQARWARSAGSRTCASCPTRCS